MNSPAGSFILKRRLFHQVSVLEKTLRPLRSQGLLGADGCCLGAGNASDQYDERQKAFHDKSPIKLVIKECNRHASDPFKLQFEFAARERNAHEIEQRRSKKWIEENEPVLAQNEARLKGAGARCSDRATYRKE
jgi:hypothetical protein